MPDQPPWSTDLAWPGDLPPFDPFDVAIQAGPYNHYAWLRANAPVIRAGPRENPLVIVSRFRDVTDGLRNAADYSSLPGSGVRVPGFLLTLDPPDHTKLRQTTNRAFTPKAMTALEPAIADLVQKHWDEVLRVGGGEMMSLFASPLTISVISTVLGVPVTQAAKMRDWTSAIIDYLGVLFRGVPRDDVDDSAFRNLTGYMAEVMDRALATDEDTIVGNLARLRSEGSLQPEEAAGFAALLFMAGHETTTLLTGNCLDFLSREPKWLTFLREPDGPALFLNEMIRFRPPVHRLTRYVHRDVMIAGYRVPSGSSVRFLIASANRDEATFENGDSFLPHRRNAAHAGFGYGIHMCVGSWLARMELRLILAAIARTTRSLTIDPAGGSMPMSGGAFATAGWQSLWLNVARAGA